MYVIILYYVKHRVYYDCDMDCIVYLGVPLGPACHTGRETCFFQEMKRLDAEQLPLPLANESSNKNDMSIQVIGESFPKTTLFQLQDTISSRKASISDSQTPASAKPSSWTARLLLDAPLLRSKVLEEADELCRASEDGEGKQRVASEMADLLYHAMVLINREEVPLEMVMETLRDRFGTSGVVEKQSRAAKS